MIASEMYALSQANRCHGTHECHWCAGPCTSLITHNDLDLMPFIRSTSGARRPANPYICIGCWLFRRKSITAFFLDGSFKDRQCPMLHSWWIEPGVSFAVDLKSIGDQEELLERLLNPPHHFSLMILDDAQENMLHRAVANNNSEILSGTSLKFTYANITHEYVPYELEDILMKDSDPSGKSSGSRVLAELLKDAPRTKSEDAQRKRNKGRPSAEEDPNDKRHRKLIRKSG